MCHDLCFGLPQSNLPTQKTGRLARGHTAGSRYSPSQKYREMSAGGPKIMNYIYYIDFCLIAGTKKQCKLLKDGTFYPKFIKISLYSTNIQTISTGNIFDEILHQQVMNDESNKQNAWITWCRQNKESIAYCWKKVPKCWLLRTYSK